MAATVDQPLLEIASDSGETFAVEDPATGERIAEVPRMGVAETRRAIARAEEALPAWRSLLAKDRARILRRWSDLMLDNEDELAHLLTTEQGKPLAESRLEVRYAASFYEWFGEEAKRVYGDTIPTYAADLEAAIGGTLMCKFRNSGQTCISANRILVQEGIYDDFVSRLVDAVSKLKVGNGLEPETSVGPLIEQAAVDKVQRHVGDALE